MRCPGKWSEDGSTSVAFQVDPELNCYEQCILIEKASTRIPDILLKKFISATDNVGVITD